MYQGPRIDFQSEGANIVQYLVSPGGASIVGAEEENYVFWSSRTQENAILDALSKKFCFCATYDFFVQQISRGAMAHPAPRPCIFAPGLTA